MNARLPLILTFALLAVAGLLVKVDHSALAQETQPANNADANAEAASGETVGSAEQDSAGNETSNASAEDAADGNAAEESAEASMDSSGGFFSNLVNTPPLGYLFQGGIFMWPLLLMGIVGVGVIIERYRSLKMLSGDSNKLRHQVRELLEAQKPEEAFELCKNEQGPVPAVLAVGLRKYLVLQKLGYDRAKIADQVVKAIDDYSVHIVAALERHLPILATVSSAAPMLGFLGTVQGMIVAFDDIVIKMGETNIVEAAASGIKVSLMTTCFGLIVGIPAFVAFNYFTSVINRFVLDVEESASELIESVTLETSIADAPKGA
ncbi:MAG: MotA/TolQ/ExbB proton channel family protein [Planctomycetota bacterium]